MERVGNLTDFLQKRSDAEHILGIALYTMFQYFIIHLQPFVT